MFRCGFTSKLDTAQLYCLTPYRIRFIHAFILTFLNSYISYHNISRDSTGVVQLIRNQQAVGSNPILGSFLCTILK